MGEEVTGVVEEYLETIYRLQKRSGAAKTSDIVEMMKVSPGAVTNAVRRLERDGYAAHEPYRGVRLTEKGLRIALRVVRKHRLLERLLSDILHVDWDRVHEIACKLEHGVDDELVRPMEEALKNPGTCPHGNPIPTESGGVVEEELHSLSELSERERGAVARITEESAELLRYLKSMELMPGASVEIVEKAPFGGPIILRVGGVTRALSRSVSSLIKVRKEA